MSVERRPVNAFEGISQARVQKVVDEIAQVEDGRFIVALHTIWSTTVQAYRFRVLITPLGAKALSLTTSEAQAWWAGYRHGRG